MKLEHYYILSDFYCDRAAIGLKKGTSGIRDFIDKSGKFYGFEFGNVIDWKNYSDGICAVKLVINGKSYWTYLDLFAKRATKEVFLLASKFINGKALVHDLDNNLRVIDTSFNTLSKRTVPLYNIYSSKIFDEYELQDKVRR